MKREQNDARGLTSGREEEKVLGVFDVVDFHRHFDRQWIEGISFGRVSTTTLQGNFTGSRPCQQFLIPSFASAERFDDLVNSFRGELGG